MLTLGAISALIGVALVLAAVEAFMEARDRRAK